MQAGHTLEKKVDSFFDQNFTQLASFYPGLSKSRLKQEIENCYKEYPGKELAMANFNVPISEPSRLRIFFDKLLLGVPLEYITRESYFFTSSFYVDERVLIPRFETEILVEMALDYVKDHNMLDIKMVDIGCGSGCIALSFMQNFRGKRLHCDFVDISNEALEVSKINYFRQEWMFPKSYQVNFTQSDRLTGLDRSYDLILSNPPYLKREDPGIHASVQKHEPDMALYINDSYRQWFETFFGQINHSLKLGGLFIMEGSEYHLSELLHLVQEVTDLQVELIQDYTKRPRFIKGRKLG